MKTLIVIIFLVLFPLAGDLAKFEDPNDQYQKEQIPASDLKKDPLEDFRKGTKSLDCDSLKSIVVSIEEKVMKAKKRKKKIFLAKAYIIVSEIAITKNCEE